MSREDKGKVRLTERGIKMAKKVIVAKMTADDKEYIGKREVKMYDGDDQLTQDANVGMTLRVQRQIRDALKVKYGLKAVSTGGESVDLSAIETV
jgi:hypothetical protein